MKALKDNHDELYDRMAAASQDAEVQPSDLLWERLERRLDSDDVTQPKAFKLFNFSTLGIAASIAIVLGLGTLVLYQYQPTYANTAAIQLEDLHRLQINPSYHTPHVDDARTIPSAIFMKAHTTSKTIEEGSEEKKIVVRKEYGMG